MHLLPGIAVVSILICAPALGEAQRSLCPGDCDGDGSVRVDEIVRGVNIALGAASLDACRASDVNKDGFVTVEELIRAVGTALAGCASVEVAAAWDVLRLAVQALQLLSEIDPQASLGTPGARVQRCRTLISPAEPNTPIPPQGQRFCGLLGFVDTRCFPGDATARLEATYAGCRNYDALNDNQILFEGSAALLFPDPPGCFEPPDEFPAFGAAYLGNVGYQLLDPFNRLVDAVVEQDLLLWFSPPGPVCVESPQTVTVSGAIQLTWPCHGEDAVFRYEGVALEHPPEEGLCALQSSASGILSVADRAASRNVGLTYDGLEVARLPDDPALFTLNGVLTASCTGRFTVKTITPLRWPRGAVCPSEGLLLLTLEENRRGRIRFAANGSVEIDLDASGSPDLFVARCNAVEIRVCGP